MLASHPSSAPRPSQVADARYAVRLACAGLSVLLALSAGGVSAQSEATTSEWSYFGADRAFTRYAPFAQIDATNVSDLEVVWRRPALDASYDLRIRWGEFNDPSLTFGFCLVLIRLGTPRLPAPGPRKPLGLGDLCACHPRRKIVASAHRSGAPLRQVCWVQFYT